ncbi:LytR/AlgR family response regulator transcription factor [Roseburia sp. 831b]|uniref:LytR/AlgR family response regulator transcription factor n=1 Tax=Roseburia sp. 831b TaxID=1261635 RepID=UPI000952D3C9|nr:LytTR family DNA-binding domain-containing protein [Roseburia sp. 831b]WVK72538.1 LytTR family DNA-binding domain-containing protein [Roseburia sp. 831b]
MLKIGICDDEQIVSEILKRKVEICLREAGVQAEITLFSQGQDLLETGEDLDILFLDIEMPEMDGIEVGKKLRQKGNDCKIIVATSMVERFKEAFYIDAFRFVTKPFEMEEIRAIGGEVELFIKGKKYRKDITLTDLERELSETLFFRISRQYIVNLGEITEQKANMVKVAGETLKVSVRKQKDFEKAYLRYKLRG